MSVYIGYWTLDPAYEAKVLDAAREGTALATANAVLAERVGALRSNLPDGVRLLGSYGSIEPNRSVFIVDADDHAALAQISSHYWGVMRFEWVPAIATALDAEEYAASQTAT